MGEHRLLVRTDERGMPIPDGESLRLHFMQFGVVTDVYSPPKTPDVAYVTLTSAGEVQAALGDSHPMIAGVPCNMAMATPRKNSSLGGGGAQVAAPSLAAPPMLMAPCQGGVLALRSPAGLPRIYVSGVAPELNAETLQAYFTYFGPVKDVYIPIDKVTGLLKPFAYVTMQNPDDTNSVLQLTTHQVTDAHSVTVALATPRLNDSVGGSPPVLAPVGFGGGSPMPGMAGGYSCGCVAPRQQRQALIAPSQAPMMCAAGSLQMMPGHQVQQLRPPLVDRSAGCRLYIARLQESIDEDMLKTYFTYFGPVKDVYIPLDKGTLQRKPFGYVTMMAPEDAQSVLQFPSHQVTEQVSVNVCMAEGRAKDGGPVPMPVRSSMGAGMPVAMPAPMAGAYGPASMRALPDLSRGAPARGMGSQQVMLRQGVPGSARLFVFGMPPGLTPDMLRGHFSRDGDITDIYIPPKTPDNAYITFATHEGLVVALANATLRISGFTVQGMKEAQPKENTRGLPRGRAEPY